MEASKLLIRTIEELRLSRRIIPQREYPLQVISLLTAYQLREAPAQGVYDGSFFCFVANIYLVVLSYQLMTIYID